MSSGIILSHVSSHVPDQYIQRFLIDVCCITCTSYAVVTDPQKWDLRWSNCLTNVPSESGKHGSNPELLKHEGIFGRSQSSRINLRAVPVETEWEHSIYLGNNSSILCSEEITGP